MSQESELEQKLAYLNLKASDRERLQELRPLFEKHAAGFVAAFYRQLLSFQPTRELVKDPGVKDRLLRKQREYLLSLADARFDAAFLEERRRIGETHERIGLEPRWYLGAYALHMSLLTPMIFEAHGADPEKALGALVAVQKHLLLDAGLGMEAYIDRHQSELAYLTEELSVEGRRLSEEFETQRAELRVTMDRARAAEELASVATLVAGLAHEIGTPMGVIQGHAKLLEKAVSGEDAQWRLRTIQEQISRISKIIQTLLNMARPRRTRRQPVQLSPLLEQSLSFVHEKLARRGIRATTSLPAVPSVVGDAERLQQLFLNLFLNAADAMPQGGDLGVELRAVGDVVEVRVSDTGVGIPADQIERVFEPFYTTKAPGRGTGLGLAIVDHIVRGHGGKMVVDSAPGRGTAMRVWLPLET